MNEYENNNCEIRKKRYLSEYKCAVNNLKKAHLFMKEWSEQSDIMVYEKCVLVSEKLFSSIEHFLKELLIRKGIDTGTQNLYQICEKLINEVELNEVEVSVFINRKEPRNQLTHSGRITELLEYERVIINLRNLIQNMYPNIYLDDVDIALEKFQSDKFFYDIDEFQLEDCHYMLIIDPVNDIKDIVLEKFVNAPWSIIVDFGSDIVNGKIYKNIRNKIDVQVCELPSVKLQGLTEKAFKYKKTVLLGVNPGEIVPKNIKKWKQIDKKNLEYFFDKANIINKKKVKVVIARSFDALTEMFLDRIIDSFGNENVEILLISQELPEYKLKELEDKYNTIITYNSYSINQAIRAIANRIGDYYGLDESIVTGGISVGNNGNEILIDDQTLIDNLNGYFEILDLSKGKDFNENSDEENFLLGRLNSWEIFKLNYDVMPIERSKYDSFLHHLRSTLGSVEAKSKIFTILHKPGFGGSILSKRIAWDMHYDYPVLILNEYESANTIQILQDFYSYCKRGILVIVDENNISKSQMENFSKDIRNAKFPAAILLVNRLNTDTRNKKYVTECTIYLQNIYKPSREELTQKCKVLASKKFDKDVAFERENLLNKVKAGEQYPLLIGLFFLEEEFKGTKDYVSHFLTILDDGEESKRIKNVLNLVALCDYFGQSKIFKGVIDRIMNPANVKKVDTIGGLKAVNDLLVCENNNGLFTIKTRHYLISKEIMEQGFLESNKSDDWRDYISKYSNMLVDLLVQVSEYKVNSEVMMFVKELYIDNRDNGYLSGKFSLLLETCKSDMEKLNILKYLVEQFDMHINNCINQNEDNNAVYHYLAHLWAHLSRIYSLKGDLNNWEKASECSNKALKYAEEVGIKDYILYHIAGDSAAKNTIFSINKIDDKEAVLLYIHNNKENIENIDVNFQLAIDYGNREYGLTGKINFWSKFIMKVLSKLDITNAFDLEGIDSKLEKMGYKSEALIIQRGIIELVEIFEYTEITEFNETAKSIFNQNRDEFMTRLYSGNNSELLMNLNNHLDKLLSVNVRDSSRIENTKRLIIRSILHKYKDKTGNTYSEFGNRKSKKVQQDYITLVKYLEENISFGDTIKESDFNLWFKLFKYGRQFTDDAINMAKVWRQNSKDIGILNPLPLYYLYVLHILRSVDGYTESLKESIVYQKECNRTCERMREESILVNYSKVRDWLIKEDDSVKLIDDASVEYSKIRDDDRFVKVKGKFIEIDPLQRRVYGYFEVYEPINLKGLKVFFRPIDAGVTEKQMNHLFEFNLGFSFERLVAFDRSVKDLTVSKTKENNLKDILENNKMKKVNVKVGNQVHFKVSYYNKKNRLLIGKILENDKSAKLHITQIDNDRFITDKDMEKYVGGESIIAKVISYDSAKDRYELSLKKSNLNDSPDKKGSMANAINNALKKPV